MDDGTEEVRETPREGGEKMKSSRDRGVHALPCLFFVSRAPVLCSLTPLVCSGSPCSVPPSC